MTAVRVHVSCVLLDIALAQRAAGGPVGVLHPAGVRITFNERLLELWAQMRATEDEVTEKPRPVMGHTLGEAICRAAGIDPVAEQIYGLTLRCWVGEVASLQIERRVLADDGELASVFQDYTLTPVEES